MIKALALEIEVMLVSPVIAREAELEPGLVLAGERRVLTVFIVRVFASWV